MSDLRALDVAFGGQGAPMAPIGEKLLFSGFSYFLNVGGIANISYKGTEQYVAFDVCMANRVLNMVSQMLGHEYDAGGEIAASGGIDQSLLSELNVMEYYKRPFPKSLAGSLGIDEVFTLIENYQLEANDALCTYVEHIAMQVSNSLQTFSGDMQNHSKLLVTGGGALNHFFVRRLRQFLEKLKLEVVIPDGLLVNYNVTVVMAITGVLRCREENNFLSTYTGAKRSSIGGAVWIGQLCKY